jgi:hypothetical protein
VWFSFKRYEFKIVWSPHVIFKHRVISVIKTLLMFMIKLCMLEFDQTCFVKIPFERSISWFHNNKEATKIHVSLKGEMWSRNKMQNGKNSITTWLTIQRPSWMNYSSNICVSPSNFNHMSFLKMFGDNIANDTLLRKLHSSPAHQLPDSLLEILATVQLKWLKTPPWQHISCLDWTT